MPDWRWSSSTGFRWSISPDFVERASKIDLNVEHLFSFSNYLTADEILLLEKIRKKLQVYGLDDYDRNAVSIIGGMELKPVNPSLSFMAQNLYELYELFIQLQNLVYHNSYLDRSIFISKVQHYYYSEQYEKCKQEIRKRILQFPKDSSFLDFYTFLSEYHSMQKENSYSILESILKDKPHLISSRSFISDLLADVKVKSLIEKYYSEKEISELREVLNRENLSNQSYIEQAKRLKKYYSDKTESTKNKAK